MQIFLKLNRWLLIYWMVLSSIRIVLGLLMFGLIFSMDAEELLLYPYEMTEIGKETRTSKF